MAIQHPAHPRFAEPMYTQPPIPAQTQPTEGNAQSTPDGGPVTKAPRARLAKTPLRSREEVLDPADLGGAWPDRHSFSRTMVRDASRNGWRIAKVRLDVDAKGRGTAEYRITAEGFEFGFLAFCDKIADDERTDRVIAKKWDITAVMFEGENSPEREAYYRANVPAQEEGRYDSRTLVLTRANRSGRYFSKIAGLLADGEQPELADLLPSPYLVRSTAFYSNGKFGLKQFGDYRSGHPLAFPYRAQMLAAWVLRELGFDLVESVARALNPAAATLDIERSRLIGVGNATGLGMVPVIVNHPDFLDAWCRVREVPLARILGTHAAPQDAILAALDEQLAHAEELLVDEQELTTAPFTAASVLTVGLRQLRAEVDDFRASNSGAQPFFAELHRHAAAIDPILRGLIAAVLIEIHPELDELAQQQYRCIIASSIVPSAFVGQLHTLLENRYGWALDIDFSDPSATAYAWVSSVDNEEPRRIPREQLQLGMMEHSSDIARRMSSLNDALEAAPAQQSVADFLRENPRQRFAVARVFGTEHLDYNDIQDNLVGSGHLPLYLQRFQLATYGMHHFSPQSTDWLRVTLYAGAPRTAELETGEELDIPLFPHSNKEDVMESRHS